MKQAKTLLWVATSCILAALAAPGPRSSLRAFDDSCAICDGKSHIPCPKCRGGRPECTKCGDAGKVACLTCKGQGQTTCKTCKGKCAADCSRCSGKGKVFLPRKFVWEPGVKGKKGGLKTVRRAKWIVCPSCKGKGQINCHRCRGAGSKACTSCRGKGSSRCSMCKGRGVDRKPCRACSGKGAIACPGCLRKDKDDEPKKEKAVVLGEEDDFEDVSDDVLNDLHWSSSLLDVKPAIKPLLAVAYVGSLEKPLGIVVLREALRIEQRWLRAVALNELLRFDGNKLAKVGGPRLVHLLISLTKNPNADTARMAKTLIETISEKYPEHVVRDTRGRKWILEEEGFPAGLDLPDLPSPLHGGDHSSGAGARRGEGKTVVVIRPKPKPSKKARELYIGAERAGLKPIDLIWAVDCSGSVNLHFRNMKRFAEISTRLLFDLFPTTGVGVVAYRDSVEASLPITKDFERFKNAIPRMVADKGGGFPEGVDVALQAAVSRKKMEWRPRSEVAVVVMGDQGPKAWRTKQLLINLKKLRAKEKRLRVHCVNVVDSYFKAAFHAFWESLARVGGGEAMYLYPADHSIVSICAAATPSVDKKMLRRILMPIVRMVGWAQRIEKPRFGRQVVSP